MDFLNHLVSEINSVLWGVFCLIPLLCGTGIFYTIKLRFVQVRKFGLATRLLFGGATLFGKRADKTGMSSFQALATAIAAQVGTGNVAGTATAIVSGGPGALFWLWVAAFFGMATIFAEAVLAQTFKGKDADGHVVGGPAYYITKGMGEKWRPMAVFFSIAIIIALGCIGNMVQSNSISNAMHTAFDVPLIVTGIVTAILSGAVFFGGVARLASVTEKIVPFMAAIYIIACLVVVFANITNIPHVFAMIFQGAFTPEGVTGGAVGITVKLCITWGVKRGVFSNEAGLGSAPIAHAASSESNPVKQGLYGIFEVFMDTIVICTLSGLTILLTADKIGLTYGKDPGTAINAAALGTVFGSKIGALIIAIGLSLFALSTVLSWGLYGTRCWEFILGTKAIKPYQVIFTLIVIVGATMDLGLAWDIADTLNGLMAIPNLIGVLVLSVVVVKTTKEFFSSGTTLRS